MDKKKTSKKHGFILADIPRYNIPEENLSEVKPEEFFKDHKAVAEVLLECLLENDTETFIEVFDAYLRVNRRKVARDSKLSRSTVQKALSKKGNPTLKTLAKIAHECVAGQ